MLGGPRPVEVGQVRLLGHGQRRRRWCARRPRARARRWLHSASSAILSAIGTVGGVDLEGARPRHLTVRRLGRQLDAPAARPARDPGHLDGAARRGRPPPPAARRPRRRTRLRRRPRRARPCRIRCRPPWSRAGRRGGARSGCGSVRRGARPPGTPTPHRARRRPGAESSSDASGIRLTGVGWRTGQPGGGVDGVDELHRTDRVGRGGRERCAVLDGGDERLELEVVGRACG